jgi:hypothetical protein
MLVIVGNLRCKERKNTLSFIRMKKKILCHGLSEAEYIFAEKEKNEKENPLPRYGWCGC